MELISEYLKKQSIFMMNENRIRLNHSLNTPNRDAPNIRLTLNETSIVLPVIRIERHMGDTPPMFEAGGRIHYPFTRQMFMTVSTSVTSDQYRDLIHLLEIGVRETLTLELSEGSIVYGRVLEIDDRTIDSNYFSNTVPQIDITFQIRNSPQ